MKTRNAPLFMSVALYLAILSTCGPKAGIQDNNPVDVAAILSRVRSHDFHPLDEAGAMTMDRHLDVAGIADTEDSDWQVRTEALRDLAGAGEDQEEEIVLGLLDSAVQVRYICAMALGIRRAQSAAGELERIAARDGISAVRSQAVIALGQMESSRSLPLLRQLSAQDSSQDVRHQCELAIYQIEHGLGVTPSLREAYRGMDSSTFKTIGTGDLAPDFLLEDVNGQEWQLKSYRDRNWVVLIWVFADWCPVCHGEFHDLIELQERLEATRVKVFTLETHDTFRGRVMMGLELEPEYWFSKKSFRELYTERIYWPHLLDRAGRIGAMYGVDPLSFSVHSEYINRPATVIIDKAGVVRFVYTGTFWGDRPSIAETLDMIESEQFDYEHPQRRKAVLQTP